jgi:hypothetical protein
MVTNMATETIPKNPVAVVRSKRKYGTGHSVYIVEYDFEGDRYITGTVIRGQEKSQNWYFGKGVDGVKEANRIALLSDEEFSKLEDDPHYSWTRKRHELEGRKSKPEPHPPAKEPWEMTQSEYRKWQVPSSKLTELRKDTPDWGTESDYAVIDSGHKSVVKEALSAGKPVPDSVLKDYPDLKAKPEKTEPKKEPWQMTQKEYTQYMSDTFEPIFHGQVVGKKVRWHGTGERAIAKQKADVLRAVPEHHRYSIKQALKEGKPVPPEVLKDYPELGKVTPKPELTKLTDQLDKLSGIEKTYWKPDTSTLTVYYDETIDKDAANTRVQKYLTENALRDSVEKITFMSTPKGTFTTPKPEAVPKAEKPKAENIDKGDFIKQEGTSYTGIVQGEASVGKMPAWKVRGPHGETSLISKADAKLIAKEKPTPPTTIKLAETKPRLPIDKVAKQSDRAMAIDRSLLAKRVVAVDDPRWLRHPNRFDVRGVDTPSRARRSKGVYADKGQRRMSRKRHRNWRRIY